MFPLLHSDFPVIRVPSNALDMVYEPMSWLEPVIKSMLMRYLTVCPSSLFICYTGFIGGCKLSWINIKTEFSREYLMVSLRVFIDCMFCIPPFILILSMTTGGSSSWPSVDMPRFPSEIFLRITRLLWPMCSTHVIWNIIITCSGMACHDGGLLRGGDVIWSGISSNPSVFAISVVLSGTLTLPGQIWVESKKMIIFSLTNIRIPRSAFLVVWGPIASNWKWNHWQVCVCVIDLSKMSSTVG